MHMGFVRHGFFLILNDSFAHSVNHGLVFDQYSMLRLPPPRNHQNWALQSLLEFLFIMSQRGLQSVVRTRYIEHIFTFWIVFRRTLSLVRFVCRQSFRNATSIRVTVPCIAARPDQPWLAFWLASASGLAEPLGAVVALSMLGASSDPPDLENVLSFVAGVMITVALRELYPEALKAAEEASKHSQQHSTRDSTR